MKVDWQRQANSASIGESASVLLGPRRGSGLESGLESTAARGPTETERLDRLGEALATSKPTVPEGEQAAIKAEVLAGARTGLAKMNQGEPPQNFTLGEHIGLEAVILKIANDPEIKMKLTQLGFEPTNIAGEPFGRDVAAELKRWDEVVDKAGLKGK